MALLKSATTAIEHWRILQRGQEKELMKARERLLDETGKKDGCGGCWRAVISEGKEERRKEGKGSQQEWSAPVSWWLSVMEATIDRESTSGMRIRRRGMPSIVAVSQRHHYLNFYWTWKRRYQDGHRREEVQGRGESLREDKIMPIDAGKRKHWVAKVEFWWVWWVWGEKKQKVKNNWRQFSSFSGEIENNLIQEGPVAALPSLIIQGDG